MLPDDMQSENKIHRGVSSFGILPIAEDATVHGVSITPEAIKCTRKSLL